MISRKQFTERHFIFQGRPFSLKGYEYLIPIYLDRVRGRRLLLKNARQTAKSTSICNLILADSFQIPNFNSLYISYTQKQTLAFSSQKIDPLLAESRKLSDYYCNGPYTRDTMMAKRFRNGSTIFLRHCYLTADSVRGLSADRIAVDEVGLLLTDNIPVIEEAASHSSYKWILYAGTPASEDSPIEDLWKNSTQNEYLLKCPFCGNWNYQDLEIIADDGLICKKCRQIMPRERIVGQWFQSVKNAPVSAYRFTQLVVPWMSHEEIIYKLKTYSTAKFYNEVLALPYTFSDTAITKDELLRVTSARSNTIEESMQFRGLPLVAAIDWGGLASSFTVISVAYSEGGVTRVVFVKKFMGIESDPLRSIDIITDICTKLGVKFVLADYGMGVTNNPLLAAKLGKLGVPVYPILYTAQREMITWEGDAQRYQANRTASMSKFFSDLRTNKIELPILGEDLLKDILSVKIQKRLVAGSDMMYYDHRADEPDDVAHSLNYANLAAPLIYNNPF